MLLKLLLDTSTLGDLLFKIEKENLTLTLADEESTQQDIVDALTLDITELYESLGVDLDQVVGTEYEPVTFAQYWVEKRL